MKTKDKIVWTLEVYKSIRAFLDYSMHDINSYDELTEQEKSCIPKEVFDQIFE